MQSSETVEKLGFAWLLAKSAGRTLRTAATARFGAHRAWPPRNMLLDDPLSLAEERTSRLRRLYANAQRDAWDGPTVFRDAVAKHGPISLPREQRIALSYPISMLMWGELAAWIVSAELAERLDDADAKMAASSQVFDEARHFYVLRDYLAWLHVPAPELDPYFAIAARTLLDTDDLDLKLFAMQILAEGTAQAIFHFLADSEIEPVLSELLPLIAKDEARHVGLGITHLPIRLAKRTPRDCARLAKRVTTLGDLFAATQIRFVRHYRALGADPRELFRRADRVLFGLSEKLGRVPGTGQPYFKTNDPTAPDYEGQLELLFPDENEKPSGVARAIKRVIDFGADALAA